MYQWLLADIYNCHAIQFTHTKVGQLKCSELTGINRIEQVSHCMTVQILFEYLPTMYLSL